ncbi:Uncharacterised protein [Candidatus Burarchaeum australiense]|nr:Uncharacterised protein [Candidatus Burarchaeum australiense]
MVQVHFSSTEGVGAGRNGRGGARPPSLLEKEPAHRSPEGRQHELSIGDLRGAIFNLVFLLRPYQEKKKQEMRKPSYLAEFGRRLGLISDKGGQEAALAPDADPALAAMLKEYNGIVSKMPRETVLEVLSEISHNGPGEFAKKFAHAEHARLREGGEHVHEKPEAPHAHGAHTHINELSLTTLLAAVGIFVSTH